MGSFGCFGKDCAASWMLAVLIWCSTGCITTALHLPKSMKICGTSKPDFTTCLAKSIQDSLGAVKNGLPELGLDKIEPLTVPELTIGAGKGPVNVVQNFKNVKLHNLSQTKVKTASVDFANKVLKVTTSHDEVRLEATYSMNGRILVLPIKGNGPCNITMYDVKGEHAISFEEFEKKGQTYWKVTKFAVSFEPGKVAFKLDNLFDGDPQLGPEINRVLNENWSEVYADVRDGYAKGFGVIFAEYANRVFARVPIKEIFVD